MPGDPRAAFKMGSSSTQSRIDALKDTLAILNQQLGEVGVADVILGAQSAAAFTQVEEQVARRRLAQIEDELVRVRDELRTLPKYAEKQQSQDSNARHTHDRIDKLSKRVRGFRATAYVCLGLLTVGWIALFADYANIRSLVGVAIHRMSRVEDEVEVASDRLSYLAGANDKLEARLIRQQQTIETLTAALEVAGREVLPTEDSDESPLGLLQIDPSVVGDSE